MVYSWPAGSSDLGQKTCCRRFAALVFEVLSKDWLRRINGAVKNRIEQLFVRACRISKRGVAVLALNGSVRRKHQGEIPARCILQFGGGCRDFGVAGLSEDIHQRDRPPPALRVGHDLTFEELPVVHVPERHGYSPRSGRAGNGGGALVSPESSFSIVSF